MSETVTIPAYLFWPLHKDYLQTAAWAALRDAALARDAGLCQHCRGPATVVHHLTYEHWQNELLFELVSLCVGCHDRVHGRGAYAPVELQTKPAAPDTTTPQERINAMAEAVLDYVKAHNGVSTVELDTIISGDFNTRRSAIEQLERNKCIYARSGFGKHGWRATGVPWVPIKPLPVLEPEAGAPPCVDPDGIDCVEWDLVCARGITPCPCPERRPGGTLEERRAAWRKAAP